MTAEIDVRPAAPGDRAAVANVLDGAVLETDDEVHRTALDAGDVLVAEPESADQSSILGAIVLDGEEVVAVAVRQKRRDQGIGRALVEAAADRRDRLVAECDRDARPFWASLGFEIAVTPEGRFLGVR